MAARSSTAKSVRTLIALGVGVVLLFGGLGAFSVWGKGSMTPKLALDLEGGTQIILTPVLTTGKAPTQEDISQAIEIIRQRVDSSGVAEAEITSQGGSNIVVALPGNPSEETLNLVRESAQMRFRAVLKTGDPTSGVQQSELEAVTAPTPNASPTATATPEPTATADAEASANPEPSGSATPEPSASASAEDTTGPTDASDTAWITDDIQKEFDDLDCTKTENLKGGSKDDPTKPLVTCEQDGSIKYILGPAEIEGSEISSAQSGLQTTSQGGTTGKWVVNISFTSQGTTDFSTVTTRIQPLDSPRNQFAMVLDGLVISAPRVNDPITNGKAEITGNFNQATATTLANQLNFGSLPMSFEVQSEQQISATLGSEQLRNGMLAGLIGLILVALYSIAQYRALGVVTILSLIIATGVTYGMLTLLGETMGYRLSLPGVAGVIVSIGITADSFIVYFERIRDELRDGRALVPAVEQGWKRARRTILASDTVNMIAAVVLYILAVGGVRGFAFTLGLTTLVDLAVVFWFTHPLITLLARTEYFGGGHPTSGLDPRRLGAPEQVRYRGRGRVGPSPSAQDRQTAAAPGGGGTIAERRAAERQLAAGRTSTTSDSTGSDA